MVKARARSRSLPRGRAVDVVVAAAPARRKHYLALLAVIQKAKRAEASGFDAYWEAVADVVEHGLFVDGGYETANAFFSDVVKMPARSATRMMRVARYASPREEEKYGIALLDAALGYIEALTGGPVPGTVRLGPIPLGLGAERPRAGDEFDETGRRRAHAAAEARGQNPRPFSRTPRDGPRRRSRSEGARSPVEEAAVEVGLELLLHVLRQLDRERAVGDRAVERVEVVADG